MIIFQMIRFGDMSNIWSFWELKIYNELLGSVYAKSYKKQIKLLSSEIRIRYEKN